MKRSTVLAIMMFFSFSIYAQQQIAKYSNGSYTYDLSPADKSVILDSIMATMGYSSCTLDSAVIDDQNPYVIDSAAYVIFYLSCDRVTTAIGFYLTKELKSGEVIFYINNDNSSIARAWECKKSGNCNQCKPERNWFLGPVVGCECAQCEFSTSGSGFPWNSVLGLIGVILNLLM